MPGECSLSRAAARKISRYEFDGGEDYLGREKIFKPLAASKSLRLLIVRPLKIKGKNPIPSSYAQAYLERARSLEIAVIRRQATCPVFFPPFLPAHAARRRARSWWAMKVLTISMARSVCGPGSFTHMCS